MTFKEKIHQQLILDTAQQIAMITATLNDLKTSASNETKSTAGDKHETALAMLQIEQDMKRGQLQTLELKKNILDKINATVHHNTVNLGSLIHTNKGYFFMSVANSAIIVDDVKVIAISPASPLGGKLMGLHPGDALQFNTKTYSIIEVM
jgi:transcription elongation GreA/GreB family factor